MKIRQISGGTVRCTFAWAALCALFASCVAQAAPAQKISIRNQVYKGQSVREGGVVWFPLEAFATAMRLKVVANGNAYALVDPNDRAPVNAAPTVATLYVNGAEVPGALTMKGSTPWVSGKAAAKALGGQYVDVPQMGTLDITMKYTPPPEARKIDSSAAVIVYDQPVFVHWTAQW
ncbi:MAG: hypothetical protein FJX76_15515 [Armatimonadetes bacterium]|nr:hypothetical protein [Armatimonadota bacterium]